MLAAATIRLRAYPSAHNAGKWVPPRELAATVADLVDALVLDRRQSTVAPVASRGGK